MNIARGYPSGTGDGDSALSIGGNTATDVPTITSEKYS